MASDPDCCDRHGDGETFRWACPECREETASAEEVAVERKCRLANEEEMVHADAEIGRLREEVKKLTEDLERETGFRAESDAKCGEALARAEKAERKVAHLRALANEWENRSRIPDTGASAPTKNDDDRRTAPAKLVVAQALRDCAKELRDEADGQDCRREAGKDGG